ncbi:type II 3-dehydroquinate dehydratase [Candidatus Fermentibacteria bacterium]|nr:type II 3-dehydroquinate dehydratase [Candidatus Fermentibacteria bacterium]
MTELPLVRVINGPNLGRLGEREPEVYGKASSEYLKTELEKAAEALRLRVELSQHDAEGEMVSSIWEASDSAIGLVVNPAGYSHYSVAVLDAMKSFPGTIVEVHISQVLARERFRANLLTATAADTVIIGAGVHGYVLALRYISSNIRP